MKFEMKIESDNEDNGPDMVAAALTRIAAGIEEGVTSGRVFDGNGNRVGDWEMSES